MARGQRDAVLERQWRERVARWATSGLSVREFSRQQGLSEASLYFWKRELQARDAAANGPVAASRVATNGNSTNAVGLGSAATQSPAAQSCATPSGSPLFVPVTVLPDATKLLAMAPATTLAVEVRCPSGHVVRLPECEIASLPSLFAALNPPASEEPSC
jgi:transposase-like protein